MNEIVQCARLVAIHLAATSGAPMTSEATAEAVVGMGLRGDRFFRDAPGDQASEGQEVTLIEREAIDRAAEEAGVDFQSRDSRRNLVTAGVRLNELVGREFAIGGVRMRGVALCEPCSHLVRLSGKRVLRSLVHHGGLRAVIVLGGSISVGDTVTPA